MINLNNCLCVIISLLHVITQINSRLNLNELNSLFKLFLVCVHESKHLSVGQWSNVAEGKIVSVVPKWPNN